MTWRFQRGYLIHIGGSEDVGKKAFYEICFTECAWDAWHFGVYSCGYFFYLSGGGGGRDYGAESCAACVQPDFCDRRDDRRRFGHSV